MDDLFGLLDGRLRIPIIDSTMMWILYYTMDKAHEKVKTKEGVIERLNEISKFYELAVIQLEGCIKFVQDETDSYSVESCHEKMLADLTEIRDRLLGRLKESELAISEKDRELMERFENELKLRQALELKEKELASLHAKLELEKKKSEDVLEFDLSNPVSGDEDRNGEFCELMHSVDQKVRHIRQHLEPDYRSVDEERNRGIDNKKVEQMSNDINFLKETLDQAFRKMQNAIFLSELGPQEQEWRWNLEKDAIYTLVKGFMKDLTDKFEVEMRMQEKRFFTGLSEHLSDLMKEVTCLRNELEQISNDNEDQLKATKGHDNSVSSSQTNPDRNIPPKARRSLSEGDNMWNSHMFSSNVEDLDLKNLCKEQPEEESGHSVAKMIKNHESIIRRKNEELNWLKRGMLWEKRCSSLRKEKDSVILKRRIQDVIEIMDNLINSNASLVETFGEYGGDHRVESSSAKTIPESEAKTRVFSGIDSLDDVWEKITYASVSFTVNEKLKNEVRMLKEEKEEGNMLTMVMEDIYAIIFKGLVTEFHTELQACDLGSYENFCSAREDLQSVCPLRKDVCTVFFRGMYKECNWSTESYNTENLLREEISWIVFKETIRDILNIANYTLSRPQEVKIPDNLTNGSSFCNEYHDIAECSVKENIYIVFFRQVIDEWKREMNACNIENLIREEIQQFVFVEAVKGTCKSFTEAEAQRQKNTSADKNYGVIKGSGEEGVIEELDMLLNYFEEEEVLMSIARFENVENNGCLDLVKLEHQELNEHEIFQEFLSEDETNFTSVKSKLEQTLEQLAMSNILLSELGSSSGTKVGDQEMVHDCVSPTEIAHDRKSFICQKKYNQEILINQDNSVFTPISGFSQIFMNFELQAHEKLWNNITRLEEMKHQLDSLVELVASIQNKESLYRKAFISRCQNLRKAENEVDLLGDQVDVLLGLLEKIYMTLHHYSPVLQQYFEVSEILNLIRKELVGAVHASCK